MLIGRYRIDGHATYGLLDPDGGTVQPVRDPFVDAPQPRGDVVDASQAERVEQLPPGEPSLIVAAAVNYRSHAIKRDPTDKPELFFKPPSSVVGPGQPIILPPDAGTVEVEGELVAVIGRTARHVPAEQAAGYVLGYTCGVDVSAREWQRADRQFWRAKGCDTFSPLGPVIATDVDPAGCELTTRVNGTVEQQTKVSELLFDVAELVAFASRHLTLRPGDLIFTGTPGTTPRITPGDVVDVTISGIGSLVNPVAAAQLDVTTTEGEL